MSSVEPRPRWPAFGRAALAVAAMCSGLLAAGCGEILGAGDYGVGCPAGTIADEGDCLEIAACGPAERPTLEGGCAPVGVDTEPCGDGFVADPERPGGCTELLPSSDCAERALVGLGTTDCAIGFTCAEPFVLPGFTALHVRKDAAPGASGSEFATIQDALDAAVALGDVEIIVHEGVYPESLTIDQKVGLVGYGTRSTVTITRSRVDGAVGAGVQIRGSSADITGLSVRAVEGDHEGLATGILVERFLQAWVPADVILRQSVVSDVSGPGIRLDDVITATLEDVTVHDVGESSGPEDGALSCAGSGVRIRRRTAPPEDAAPILLRRLLVDGARESGIHVEGAEVRVEDTLVRDIAPCGTRFGDGLVAYGYDFSPSHLDVSGARVDAAARYPVAVFEAQASLEGAALGSCEGAAVSGDGSTLAEGEASLCECDGAWSRCPAGEQAAEAALYGFGGCDPSSDLCVEWCAANLLGTGGARRIPDASSFWVTPAAAVGHSSSEGCFLRTALQGQSRAVSFAEGFSPLSTGARAAGTGQAITGLAGLVSDTASNLQPLLNGPDRRDELSDLRRALYIPVQVCRWPAGPIEPEQEVCFGVGVEGVRAELLREDGTAIAAPWASPRYFGVDTNAPDPAFTATSTNGTAYFWNVPGGHYLVRLRPPAGKTLSCSLDPHDSGFEWGLQGEEENTLRVYAAPGLNSIAGRMFCTLE